jgi:hypothetical protein
VAKFPSPLGEISGSNPVYSISSRHDFATYFGQSFAALPGLADQLTFRVSAPFVGSDAIDFRVLIAETSVDQGVYTPTTVVFRSDVFLLVLC